VRFIHAGVTSAVMQGRISAEEFLSPYLQEIAAAAGKAEELAAFTN